METVNNVKGCIVSDIESFKEFKISGLLLPKDKVSRNGILYDWDSVKKMSPNFSGVTLNYNHIIDGPDKPVGKVEKTWIKEVEDEQGPAGLYYQADVDPDSPYADSINKGYLNKVSLQVTADSKREQNDDGEVYTRAFIKDALEISVVKVPGFNETTLEVALAEAYKAHKEAGQTTQTAPSQTKVPDEDEEEEYLSTVKKAVEYEKEKHPELCEESLVEGVIENLMLNKEYYKEIMFIEMLKTDDIKEILESF
jgi:hypothetical protein